MKKHKILTNLSKADVTFYGEAIYDRAGESHAEVAEFNNEGYDDILIGAPDNDDGGNAAGKVFFTTLTSIPYIYFKAVFYRFFWVIHIRMRRRTNGRPSFSICFIFFILILTPLFFFYCPMFISSRLFHEGA
ncbi:MAG: integrin alpha [Promethearchaeia archaeon]